MWQRFLEIAHLGEYLSLGGLLLSFLGFGATVILSAKAKRAAEGAQEAAQSAVKEVHKMDLVAEIATISQLLEEIKRLQRANAVEVLVDRYSGLRSKLVAIRESLLLIGNEEQVLVQDVIARIANLQKTLDRNSRYFEDVRQLALSNESISICIEAVITLSQRVKNNIQVAI